MWQVINDSVASIFILSHFVLDVYQSFRSMCKVFVIKLIKVNRHRKIRLARVTNFSF